MHTTVPSYSTICKRINNLDLDLTTDRKTHGTIVIAIDSTGIKVTNRGDWMREKHGVTRKGFIKIHAVISAPDGSQDSKTRLFGMEKIFWIWKTMDC